MVPGLIGVGQALENRAHWAVLAVSWGLYTTGGILVSCALYSLFKYFPAASKCLILTPSDRPRRVLRLIALIRIPLPAEKSPVG